MPHIERFLLLFLLPLRRLENVQFCAFSNFFIKYKHTLLANKSFFPEFHRCDQSAETILTLKKVKMC